MKLNTKKTKSIKEDRYANLITHHDPKNPIAESFRTLRTNIQFAGIDHALNTIMVTSTGPSEGKSTIIANLAIAMAQSDKKVLLIDADLRKPTVHHSFRLSNWLGLTNMLVEARSSSETIQVTEIPNLSVLTSGPIPPNPSELLGSKKMRNLIEHLQTLYDVILFDAPPVLAVTDSQILSGYVDGVLLVVKSGSTHKEMAIKAKQQLEQVKANMLGIILNNQKEQVNNNYYYYYGN